MKLQPRGHGKATNNQGESYEGTWLDGVPHGICE